MKLLVINNLSSGFGEGAVYDFVRSFMQDGDEACLRSTDGTTGVSTLLDLSLIHISEPTRRS